MPLTEPVKRILASYESDNPGTNANLARILIQGKLGGTSRLLILPVDQGVEHGPARSFAPFIGRNTSQRPKDQALDMLNKIIKIYQGKD